MPVRTFRDLHVWQKALLLVEETYRIIHALPTQERPVLGDQMRRAATSIPANIAEGHMRFHRKEYLQFLAIAHGSAAELETHIVVARRINAVPADAVDQALTLCTEIDRMLCALRARLGQTFPTPPRRSAPPPSSLLPPGP